MTTMSRSTARPARATPASSGSKARNTSCRTATSCISGSPTELTRWRDLLHYEDFAVGETRDLGRYQVTAEEIMAFAREFDPQPFHLDEDAGQSFGARRACALPAGIPAPCSCA